MRHFKTGNQPRRIIIDGKAMGDDDLGDDNLGIGALGIDEELRKYVEEDQGEAHAQKDAPKSSAAAKDPNSTLDKAGDDFEDGFELETTDIGLSPLKALSVVSPLSRASLLVCIGQNVGHAYPLLGEEITIGRDPRSDVVVDDRKASASHCKIIRGGDAHRLLDLESANGVLVNASRVTSTELRHGDLLQVGRSVFRYWLGDPVHGDPRGAQGLVPALPSAEPLANEDAEYVVEEPSTREERLARRPDQSWAYEDEVSYSAELIDRRLPPGPRPATAAAEGDMSLHEMLLQLGRVYAFFRPYWKSILAFIVLGAVAGGLSILAKPPMQAAMFQVELTPKVADNPVNDFERSNVEFFRSAEQNFKSQKLIKKTLLSLGERNTTPEFISAVQAGLQFGIVGPQEPNTYLGRFQAPEAEFAKQFLDTHVELYLQTEISKTLKVIQVEADFLRTQLKKMESELQRTEGELLTFKKENIDGLPAQARHYYDYLFELQRKQQQVGKTLDSISAQLSAGQRALTTEQPLIETRVLNTRPYQQAKIDVRRRLAEAKAAGKGAKHPDVLALQRELASLADLAKGGDGGAAEVERSANPLHRELQNSVHKLSVSRQITEKEAQRLKADYERVKGIVSRLPELEAKYADLTRSYDATKALHTRIFKQLKTTMLQLDLERASASARYDIITPPTVVFISIPRTIMKRALMGLFLGLILGFMFAAARQVKKELFL